MEDFEEIVKRLDLLLKDDDEEDDEENAIELRITARKKDPEKAPTLDELFDGLISEYNRWVRTKDDGIFSSFRRSNPFLTDSSHSDTDPVPEKVAESACMIKLAVNNYLSVTDENGEHFVLIPERDGTRFAVGSEHILFTREYKGHSFLAADCPKEDKEKYPSVFDEPDTAVRCELLRQARSDPKGFALWGHLGTVKRPEAPIETVCGMTTRKQAAELMKRIPLDRDDLYRSLDRTLKRCLHGPNSEKLDHEENLVTKMRVISMILAHREPDPCTADRLSGILGEAKVTERNRTGTSGRERLPNILFVGRDYNRALECIRGDGKLICEISLAGVEGNEYLFGDEMSYYCSGHGELVSRLTEEAEAPSMVVFSNADLMGASVRSSDPLYGLAALLRKHAFHDFYMRDLAIDIGYIQLACHVDRLEDCPELLLREMDIIVEL